MKRIFGVILFLLLLVVSSAHAEDQFQCLTNCENARTECGNLFNDDPRRMEGNFMCMHKRNVCRKMCDDAGNMVFDKNGKLESPMDEFFFGGMEPEPEGFPALRWEEKKFNVQGSRGLWFLLERYIV